MARAATWRERVREWRESGLEAKEFAEARGLSVHQLWNWAAKFRNEDRAKAADAAPTIATSTAPGSEATKADGVRLARVVRLPTHAAAGQSRCMSIEFSEARIVVPEGCDRATFALVLDAIERRKAGPGER